MPWRSGGGTTTELVIEPPHASVGDRFHYRMSIADVAVDGPFSRFEGYDRHIMLLEGRGMSLDCGAHGPIVLDAPLVPHPFAGDWDVRGRLLDGPVRDLNLIVDRAWARSSLTVRDLGAGEALDITDATLCVIHVIHGSLADASAGDTLVAHQPAPLVASRRARVAVAHVTPR